MSLKWQDFSKITKNAKAALNPSGTVRQLLDSTGKTIVTVARQRARKDTHAMEKSTDYQMTSDTTMQTYVGVTYGRWQDEGTSRMEGNQFFTSANQEGWVHLQKGLTDWWNYLVSHNFDPGFKVPNSVGVSGTTTGTVQGKTTKRTISKSITPKKQKKYVSRKRGSKGWIYTYR